MSCGRPNYWLHWPKANVLSPRVAPDAKGLGPIELVFQVIARFSINQKAVNPG